MSRSWRDRARALRAEVLAVVLVVQHPRTPWYAKVVAALVVAYALSPIDLIPDFIPVIGHLDDLVLVPLGVALVMSLVPADVLAECRASARQMQGRPASWAGAALVILVWLLAGAGLAFVLAR